MNAHPSSLSDRELLELAAKAAGVPGKYVGGDIVHMDESSISFWNPLRKDDDALRLAVKLRLEVDFYCRWGDDAEVADCSGQLEATGLDAEAATRRAIVRAAAELAK